VSHAATWWQKLVANFPSLRIWRIDLSIDLIENHRHLLEDFSAAINTQTDNKKHKQHTRTEFVKTAENFFIHLLYLPWLHSSI
jgi:hypothetical protein